MPITSSACSAKNSKAKKFWRRIEPFHRSARKWVPHVSILRRGKARTLKRNSIDPHERLVPHPSSAWVGKHETSSAELPSAREITGAPRFWDLGKHEAYRPDEGMVSPAVPQPLAGRDRPQRACLQLSGLLSRHGRNLQGDALELSRAPSPLLLAEPVTKVEKKNCRTPFL